MQDRGKRSQKYDNTLGRRPRETGDQTSVDQRKDPPDARKREGGSTTIGKRTYHLGVKATPTFVVK